MMNKLIAFILGLLAFAINASPSLQEIFPATHNKLVPSNLWLTNKKPYPTNAWFINFALINKGLNEPVNVSPYLLKISKQGIGLSYSSPHTYAEIAYPNIISALFYQYEDQLTLGCQEDMDDFGLHSYHGMQVMLQWTNPQHKKINAPIIQGSPYLTEVFTETTPKLTSRFKWLSINKQPQQAQPLKETNRFEIKLALDETNTQTWIMYSEYPISFTWTTGRDGETLLATKEYSGWIRLILQADTPQGINNDESILDAYSQTIPLDYKQNYLLTDKSLIYSWSWQTQDGKPPLMLSLPHQRSRLMEIVPVHYWGMKGLLAAQTQKDWHIELPRLPILFLEPKTLSPAQITILRQSLKVEATAFIKDKFPSEGPYLTGKRMARVARLILIADYLHAFDLMHEMLARLELILEEKMLGQSSWFFQYDETWGGIIPSQDDYGARHYNDHHYHYGYWVYAFAVLAKFDPQWLNTPLKTKSFTPREWINNLILDYANKDPNNPYFPLQRHQDDYAGHSWASGLTATAAGQNQQSSSEAVHAYYALALYAKAIQDKDTYAWACFLMGRELRAAQLYWQIAANNSVYSEQFKKNNQVVGNLWASKVDANAYFVSCTNAYRCGLQYSFGMQMLPFTAITRYLLHKDWLLHASPAIRGLISGKLAKVEPAWRWILIKGIAPILNKEEKIVFFQQAVDSKPDEYDNGDSKTNTLYFLIDE
ncbi:glycosyl hydrolase [Legionella septentrionalis]|uniref:glucan endo-1,3-beta-D-glucosidase n=1 Tax=Legionella septentrionalis TaxID=2498109 RepID=A0A433JGZ8_9GAMM|nr:glycosyl hydrolase [Legionella septentrionalis]RUQ81567.1 hypothetical protein EKM59_10300 [Legionella septentrionalis]